MKMKKDYLYLFEGSVYNVIVVCVKVDSSGDFWVTEVDIVDEMFASNSLNENAWWTSGQHYRFKEMCHISKRPELLI